jgi:hypothetical protein
MFTITEAIKEIRNITNSETLGELEKIQFINNILQNLICKNEIIKS